MGEKTQPVSKAPMVSVSKGQLAAYERKRFEAMEELTGLAIDKDVVIELCQYIDCSALRSVAEERYLNNTCGYVLCSNSLSPKSTLPTYSLRGNRIHLNKERVWFCSRLCQGKYHYLAAQLPEEPFWACLKAQRKTLVFLDSPDVGAANLTRQEDKRELDDLTSALSAVNIDDSLSDASANEELAELENSVQNSEQLSNGDVESTTSVRTDVSTRRSGTFSSASTSQIESPSAEERLERIRALYFEKAGSRLKAKTKPPTLIDPMPLPISINNSACAKSGKLTQSEYEENCRMIREWFKGITLNWNSLQEQRQAILSSKEVMKHVRLACQSDSQDQKRLRRSIFYAGVSKSLPLLFQSIGLELTGAYKDDLKLVVSSLQLDAGNVALKPSQWTLTAHFLLSIISFQRPELMRSMESEKGREFCRELLSSTDCSPDAYRKFIEDMQALCN